MDEKLKEAIAAVRTGDKREAQRQLTTLLQEDPEQVQGWYLLSLLVDSPQKQAAYLSKTLALNPNHEKAREQLAALQASGNLGPTAPSLEAMDESFDLVTQADTDALPDWLIDANDEDEPEITAVPHLPEETIVPNETLPDWLKEPAAVKAKPAAPTAIIEEEPTVVGQKAEGTTRPDHVVADLKKTLDKPSAKRAAPVPKNKTSTRNLNILLGMLVIIALIVIVLLAYLLLS